MKQRKAFVCVCFNNKEEDNGDKSANYKMKVGGGGKGTTEWSLIVTFTYYTQVTK